MARKSKPIRMCVNCRKRYFQKDLIRLQKVKSEVVAYNGSGRSFYICKECLESSKFLTKKVCGMLKVKEESLLKVIKEFKDNVED